MLYWLLKLLVAGPAIRAVVRPWSRGLHNLPESGPAILASNHLSFSDSIIMPLAVPRRVTFPAKAEYFTTKGIKGRLMALFFRSIGQVPMDRSGGRASAAALDTAAGMLAEGEFFGIYPEGTRSPDGRLYKGRTGVARLALRSGAPVIPVAMIDTDTMQPLGRLLPNLRVRPGVVFGEPIDFSRYQGMENDRFILRSVTDEIMYAIMTLSGQEYVDVYGSKAKADLAATKAARGRPVPAAEPLHEPGVLPDPLADPRADELPEAGEPSGATELPLPPESQVEHRRAS